MPGHPTTYFKGVRRVVLRLFFWLQMYCISLKAAGDPPIIETASGKIQGISVNNPDADAFLGIPFAKPPVGPLRFRRPEPMGTWEGTLDATRFAKACYQFVERSEKSVNKMFNPKTEVSEDCLHLNVWVPVPRPTKAPVMVWIHGGLFVSGSTSRDMFNGKYLAAEENVIVVTMAFRLGVFGFFYLGHESAPGNQGLYDQAMGLQWIHDNIKNFGGDPDRVTLFGTGSGGLSISLHLMSPLSQDLFHRAIIQSGVPGPPKIGYQVDNATEAKRKALLYAFDYLECPRFKSPEAISDCMRDMTPDVIINNQLFPSSSRIFMPCVDGAFLTRSTDENLRKGLFKKSPILIGNVRNEGSRYVYNSAPEYLNLTHKTMTYDEFVVTLNRIFTYYPSYPTQTKPEVREKLIELYRNKDNPDDTDTNLAALDSAYSDAYFVCPTNEFARAYSSHGQNVYMYRMTQRYEKSPWPKWMGVVHADDMYFVFGSPIVPGIGLTDEEKPLSKAMMNYWANYARTGNPNTRASDKTKTIRIWPTYSEASEWSYLELNLRYFISAGDSSSTKKGFRIKECPAVLAILTETDGAEKVSAAWLTFNTLIAVIFHFLLMTRVTLPSTCSWLACNHN